MARTKGFIVWFMYQDLCPTNEIIINRRDKTKLCKSCYKHYLKQIKHAKTTTLGSCAKKLEWYHA